MSRKNQAHFNIRKKSSCLQTDNLNLDPNATLLSHVRIISQENEASSSPVEFNGNQAVIW